MVVPSQGEVVEAAGTTPVTVYARAYPEAEAYEGTEVPDQGQPTLDSLPSSPASATWSATRPFPPTTTTPSRSTAPCRGDKTVIPGQEVYYQVWVGHRLGYVKAAEVSVLPGR